MLSLEPLPLPIIAFNCSPVEIKTQWFIFYIDFQLLTLNLRIIWKSIPLSISHRRTPLSLCDILMVPVSLIFFLNLDSLVGSNISLGCLWVVGPG